MEWFRRLAAWLGGTCRHRWVTERCVQVLDRDTLERVGTRYTLRCKRCGWVEGKYIGT